MIKTRTGNLTLV